MSNILKKEKGFTLIEIVLVLAIAGLLLVIVFLAVSGAQKSRRDSQRKNDNARLLSQIESFASNKSGVYPTAVEFTSQFVPATGTGVYTPNNFNDPTTGKLYTAVALGGAPGAIVYTQGAVGKTSCDGTAMTGVREVKLEMQLEQGVACVDNH